MAAASGAAMRAARRVINPVGQKAVHLKISPRTANIRESRAVLRLLQSYGEVVQFRNMQYDIRDRVAPHLMYAVFADQASASSLVAASPLTCIVPPNPLDTAPVVPPENLGMVAALEAAGSILSPAGHATSLPSPGSAVYERGSGPREFTLVAELSVGYDHAKETARQQSYWDYSNVAQGVPQVEMQKVVPVAGMADLSTSPARLPYRLVLNKMKQVQQQPTIDELYEEYLQAPEDFTDAGSVVRKVKGKGRRYGGE